MSWDRQFRLPELVEALKDALIGKKVEVKSRGKNKKLGAFFEKQLRLLFLARTLGEDPTTIIRRKKIIERVKQVGDQFKIKEQHVSQSVGHYRRLSITHQTQKNLRKLAKHMGENVYLAGANPNIRFAFKKYQDAIPQNMPIILGKGDLHAAHEFFSQYLNRYKASQQAQLNLPPLVLIDRDGYWQPFLDLLGLSVNDHDERANAYVVSSPRAAEQIANQYNNSLKLVRPKQKPQMPNVPKGSVIFFCTTNPEKLEQNQRIFSHHNADIKFLSIDHLVDVMPDIDEINKNYSGNAELKLQFILDYFIDNQELVVGVCEHYKITPAQLFFVSEDQGGYFEDERIMMHEVFQDARHLMIDHTSFHPGPELKPVIDALNGHKEFIAKIKKSIQSIEQSGETVNKVFQQTSIFMFSSVERGAPILSMTGYTECSFHDEFPIPKTGKVYFKDFLSPNKSTRTISELEIAAEKHPNTKKHTKYLCEQSHNARAIKTFMQYCSVPTMQKSVERVTSQDFTVGLVAADAAKLMQNFPGIIEQLNESGIHINVFDGNLDNATSLFDFMKTVDQVTILPSIEVDDAKPSLYKAILAASILVGVQIQDESMKGKNLTFVEGYENGWQFFHQDMVDHLHANTFLLPQKTRYLYDQVDVESYLDHIQKIKMQYVPPYLRSIATPAFDLSYDTSRAAFIAGSATTEALGFQKTASALAYKLAMSGHFDIILNGAGGKGAMGPMVEGVRQAQKEGAKIDIHGITTPQLAKKEQCDYALYNDQVHLVDNIEVREEKLTQPKFHYIVDGGMGTVKEALKSAKSDSYTVIVNTELNMETYKGGTYSPIINALKLKGMESVFVVDSVDSAVELTDRLKNQEAKIKRLEQGNLKPAKPTDDLSDAFKLPVSEQDNTPKAPNQQKSRN